MKNDQNLDVLLRSMDAAEQTLPPDPTRAQADLNHILRSHPAPAATYEQGTAANKPTARKTNRRRRTVILGGLAAAATAGLLIMPALSGGDPAFATWTAEPAALRGSELDNAVSDCRNSKGDVGGGMYSADLTTAEVAIAERRGSWATVVLSGPDGFEATCTTDSTAPWFNKGMFGSIGKLGNETAPAARGLAATQLGTGVISNAPLSIASGRAGSDIEAITYTNAAGESVIATVAKGQFAFWLPGNELENASEQGVAVNVTYRDGSTETQLLNF